jgi:hypothetical protein
MAEGLTAKEQRQVRRSCRHHWIIESPHGATSRGRCKRCGTMKRFPNASADNIWDSAGSGLGRWARREARPQSISLAKEKR